MNIERSAPAATISITLSGLTETDVADLMAGIDANDGNLTRRALYNELRDAKKRLARLQEAADKPDPVMRGGVARAARDEVPG